MGFSYDFFVGRLPCPGCGHVSPPDSSTNIQTYIRDEPQLAFMGEGFRLQNLADMENRGYWLIRQPVPGEPIQLLETWECPACGQTFNWAQVSIQDGVIKRVEAVELNRATLERAHFISDEAVYVAAGLDGRPTDELVGTSPVPILRRRLPAGTAT